MAKDTDTTEIKIQVARVEERLVSMCEKQEGIAKEITAISSKLDMHHQNVELYKGDVTKLNTEYKTDKKWAIGIFSILYGVLIAWFEWRGKS